MKLKRLHLQGYKTFATRTEFDFNAGITAIVGPNGSGKSNIADAIRWVLGEQSYSTLRGKRTADMIFAGSQTRARAGMAQAILTLDNSDEWLPIDYAEVEIGRRAFRSGENEYLLNGQKVRLRDVQDLLATSGLAERTYTIIGQGLIDQALSLRADERRALFEEAAGINHYQARRAQTLRQLEKTQRNLERVHDILAEIRPRLGALKRQANRAQTYGQVEADLRHLLRIWYGYQWEAKKKAVREQRQVADDAEAEWKESRRRLAGHQSKIGRLNRHVSEVRQKIEEQRARRDELRQDRESAERQVAVLGERDTLLARQLAELQGEVPHLEEQYGAAQTALEEALSGLEAAQQQLAERQEHLQRFNQSFRDQQVEIDRWSQTIADLEADQRKEQKQLAKAEGQHSQLQERIEERQEQRPAPAELEEAHGRVVASEEALHQAHKRLAVLQEERVELKSQREEAQDRFNQAQKERGHLAERLTELKEEVAALRARFSVLDQMRLGEIEVADGLSFLGRLATLIQIPARYQLAMETALGVRLNTLAVQDEDSLWHLLETNDAEQPIVAAAVEAVSSPDAEPLPHVEGVVGWAVDLVDYGKEIEPIARLLFQHVLIVESRQAAFAAGRRLRPGSVAVTADGFAVRGGGLVESAGNSQNGVLAREESWRQVQGELKERHSALEETRQALAQQETSISSLRDAIDSLDGQGQRLAAKIDEAKREVAQGERQVDKAEQQREFWQERERIAEEETQRLRQRLESVEESIERHREQIVQLESSVQEARLELEALPVAEAKQQRQNRRQEVESARTIVAGRQAVVESRRATLQQVEGQLRRQQERRNRLKSERGQLDLEEARTQRQHLQEEIKGVEAALAPLSDQLKQLRAEIEGVEEALSLEQRRAHDLETYYTQAKVALSQRESELDGLAERIQADLGLVALTFDEDQGGQTPLPFDEVVERLPAVDDLPDDIEETIRDYRAQLQRIGSVNPDAPAEYEQTQERYHFLSQQIEDLSRTEKRLRRVIAELDDLTSQAFAATVKEVDDIFGEMFERLFGGGAARLILTDPDELTTSGVDIVCRLPSRRQQRLALLSGGERSLTATALIFSLLKVSPPPFCVLDEVDAMLDEANVNRFRSVLRELSQNSQFIVITHNRGTVQAAQTVYGISMGTDSASQVISIKPEEYVNGDRGHQVEMAAE